MIGRITARYLGIIENIGDDLRQFHPQYRQLMGDDPLAMPDATAYESGRWVGVALDYVREARNGSIETMHVINAHGRQPSSILLV